MSIVTISKLILKHIQLNVIWLYGIRLHIFPQQYQIFTRLKSWLLLAYILKKCKAQLYPKLVCVPSSVSTNTLYAARCTKRSGKQTGLSKIRLMCRYNKHTTRSTLYCHQRLIIRCERLESCADCEQACVFTG